MRLIENIWREISRVAANLRERDLIMRERSMEILDLVLPDEKTRVEKTKERGLRACRKRKRLVRRIKNEHHDLKPLSRFLEEVDEDILLEIFVRLPNYRSAILFAAVCHKWQSLISRPRSISRFISHHNEHKDRYPQPCTIIFHRAYYLGYLNERFTLPHFQPICKLSSQDSMFLRQTSNTATNYLDFLPSPMAIRASCNDLLLVSPHLSCWKHLYYICNPITRQFHRLPKIAPTVRDLYTVGQALICMPDNEFKVVVLDKSHMPLPIVEEDEISSHRVYSEVRIFSSKTGTWESKCLEYPTTRDRWWVYWVEMITCPISGVVYWLEQDYNMDRVLSLDLRNESKVGIVDFPDDYWWHPMSATDVRKSQKRSGIKGDHVKSQIGVVSGELWLLQFVSTIVKGMINLKVWRLNNCSKWILVEDRKNLKDPINEEAAAEEFVGGFTHPLNNEALILVWGRNIVEYKLTDGTVEILGVLQEYINLSEFAWYMDERLVCTPMMLPTWPTTLPASKSL
ncbi:F-box family protein [Striga asiatica]|uniref:F-box family protein n=1 Tax=Striga asiatica TaxID=4170 RepID=A0A5A7QHY5_STRAF|nr:F-box family protein [Striga asiatica]